MRSVVLFYIIVTAHTDTYKREKKLTNLRLKWSLITQPIRQTTKPLQAINNSVAK